MKVKRRKERELHLAPAATGFKQLVLTSLHNGSLCHRSHFTFTKFSPTLLGARAEGWCPDCISQANQVQKSLLYLTSVPQCIDCIFPSQKKAPFLFLENISSSRNLLKLRRALQAQIFTHLLHALSSLWLSPSFAPPGTKAVHIRVFTNLRSLQKPRKLSVPHACSGALWHNTMLWGEHAVWACRVLSCRTSSTHHPWGAAVLFLPHFKQEAEALTFSCFFSLAVAGYQLFA